MKASEVIRFQSPSEINWRLTEKAISEVVKTENPDALPEENAKTTRLYTQTLKEFVSRIGVPAIFATIKFLTGKVQFR